MNAQALKAPRFIRKTQLAPGEYRKNFHQIDRDIIEAITSEEADQVTSLMSKIYLRLVNTPSKYFEREGVLRFEAEWRETGQVKAWAVLCEVLGVASATASKALAWMHEVGVIGYFSAKNGVGIRIFLNRAASSIGRRENQPGKKILQFTPASSVNAAASRNEAAFNDSFAVEDRVLDSDLFAAAPDKKMVVKNESEHGLETAVGSGTGKEGREVLEAKTAVTRGISIDEIVQRIRSEIGPTVESAAQRAAHREHERTREWLEAKGLPKAARVAQREAYNVLRSHGLISASAQASRRDADVGRSHAVEVEAKPLNPDEIKMFAEVCVALLETQGQAIDVTLSEMSVEVGGSVLPEDAPKIREAAELLLSSNAKDGERSASGSRHLTDQSCGERAQ